MTTITLKNISELLHKRLKHQALVNHRSLNSEILFQLKRSVDIKPVDVQGVLKDVRALRKRIGGSINDQMISKFKNEGR